MCDKIKDEGGWEYAKQCNLTVGRLREALRFYKDDAELIFYMNAGPPLFLGRVKCNGDNAVRIEFEIPTKDHFPE